MSFLIDETPEEVGQRRLMVENQLRRRGISDEKVLAAMEEIPRQIFVPPELRPVACEDGPLPIGYDQTISQPYIVALMSEKLAIGPDEEVLEVGTGCGYQTAILALLARRVYTIEFIPELARHGRANLEKLGLKNIEYHIGDGRQGWPAPRQFNGILSAAAAPEVPPAWRAQLADGGRLIGPVGPVEQQKLMLMRKLGVTWTEHHLCWCRFVPLK